MSEITAADVSVIVPVGNGAPLATEVVRRILAASSRPGELIVVNDRVTDGSLDGLREFLGVKIVDNDGPRGPAAARNAGARAATRPILLFMDADVFVAPDTLGKLVMEYNRLGSDAIIAVQDAAALPGEASRYKNLWMRYTYLRTPETVDLFYTTCAVIKKESFWAAGGFDENYTEPSVEDTAFGRALAARGFSVAVAKDVAVTHWKTYTAPGLIKTTFKRGRAMARCVMRTRGRGGGNRTSVPTASVLAVIAAGLLPIWVFVGVLAGAAGIFGAAANFAALYVLSAGWLRYLWRNDFRVALWALWFLPVELCAAFAGGVCGVGGYVFWGKKY